MRNMFDAELKSDRELNKGKIGLWEGKKRRKRTEAGI